MCWQALVQLLLNAGCSAVAKNADNQTPGMLASVLGKVELAQYFAALISQHMMADYARKSPKK